MITVMEIKEERDTTVEQIELKIMSLIRIEMGVDRDFILSVAQ